MTPRPPQVTRIDGTVDAPPCLRLSRRTSGSPPAPPELLFLRLSLPVQFQPHFRCPAGTTPLPQTPPEPPDDEGGLEPMSEFEKLRRSAGVRNAEGGEGGGGEGEKNLGGGGGSGPAGAPSPNKEQQRGENEKDGSNEKGRKRRG